MNSYLHYLMDLL